MEKEEKNASQSVSVVWVYLFSTPITTESLYKDGHYRQKWKSNEALFATKFPEEWKLTRDGDN